MNMTGADAAALEQNARQLDAGAAELDRIRVNLRHRLYNVNFHGPASDRFRHQWDAIYGPRLMRAASALRTAGAHLRRQAAQQRQASTAGGGERWIPSFGGSPVRAPSVWSTLGSALRNADSLMSPFAGLASTLHDVKNIPGADAAAKTFAVFGAATTAYTVGENLAERKYVDAGLEAGLYGGDVAADFMKTKGPHGYLYGVTTQTWVEVGREARNVDWSAQGLQQIKDASVADWGSGLAYAAKQMPAKLVKIFSL